MTVRQLINILYMFPMEAQVFLDDAAECVGVIPGSDSVGEYIDLVSKEYPSMLTPES